MEKLKKTFDPKEYAKEYRKKNAEKIKEYRLKNPNYNKEYRKNNLEKIKALFATRVKCECGKEIRQYYIKTHKKSGAHFKELSKQIN